MPHRQQTMQKMELRIHELSNYVLVLEMLSVSWSNASDGKSSSSTFVICNILKSGFFFSSYRAHAAFCLFFFLSFLYFISINMSLMLVVNLSAEAQLEKWFTPNLSLTSCPYLISPTLVRIMFSKAVSVDLLVSTYHHAFPNSTWLHSPISSMEKSCVNCSHPTFTITPENSSLASSSSL